MKKIIIAAAAISILAFAGNTHAQNNKEKKDKKVSIKIISEENGKKTVVDTTFNAKDDEAIEAFMKAHNIDKPLPPVPPTPPSAPNAPKGITPPAPPTPPKADDDGYSFHFDFDDKDFGAFGDDLAKEMEKVKEQIEEAKEALKQSLKEIKISKEDLKKLQDEINKELDKIDIKVDGEKNNKRVIIKRKTGDAGTEDDSNWSTNAFVTGNGKIVKCITTEGNKTNCRMMVITDDKEVNSDEGNTKTKKEDKDPEAPSTEKKVSSGNNQLNTDDFKVFPNPNDGSFDLLFHLDTHGKTTINVIDASGKEVFSESFADFTGDYKKHIELPSKEKGTYLLNVKQEDRWMHKKFVVK